MTCWWTRHVVSRRTWAWIAVALSVSALSGHVAADGGVTRRSQALFEEAKGLMARGNYAEACPKLEESFRLEPANGTKLNLADCYDHVGRTASAWALFVEVADAAKAAKRTAAERVARERAAKLEPKLAHLVINVPAPTDGLTVVRDGVAVERASWGTPVPVDPGDHQIEATAPGKPPFRQLIVVNSDGATVTVSVDLRSAPADAAVKSPPPVEPARTAATSTPVTPESGSTGSGSQRGIGIAVASVGLVGIVVGSVFGLQAMSKHNEAVDEHCPQYPRCDATGVDLTSQAKAAATLSTIAFVVGGAALVGGVVLFATAPHRGAHASMPAQSHIALRGTTAAVEGRW